MAMFRNDGEPTRSPDDSGKADPPSQDSGSRLESVLHRRDCRTKRFVKLHPEDRQLYLPFIGKRR